MSLVTFSFMLGGALGTGLGGRLIAATSLNRFYLVYAIGLGLLALASIPALGAIATPRSDSAQAKA